MNNSILRHTASLCQNKLQEHSVFPVFTESHRHQWLAIVRTLHTTGGDFSCALPNTHVICMLNDTVLMATGQHTQSMATFFRQVCPHYNHISTLFFVLVSHVLPPLIWFTYTGTNNVSFFPEACTKKSFCYLHIFLYIEDILMESITLLSFYVYIEFCVWKHMRIWKF